MTTSDQKPDTDERARSGAAEAPLASLVGDFEESQADNPAQAKGTFYCRTYLRLVPVLWLLLHHCGHARRLTRGCRDSCRDGFRRADGRVAPDRTNSAWCAHDVSLDLVSLGWRPRADLQLGVTGLGQGRLGSGIHLYRLCRASAGAVQCHQNDDTTHFTGLALLRRRLRPSGMDGSNPRWTGPALDWVHALPLTALGFLMISRFSYASFKSINFDRRVPFVRMLSVVTILGLIALDPPLAIWCMAVVYALSGPAQYLRQADKPSQEGTLQHEKTDLH